MERLKHFIEYLLLHTLKNRRVHKARRNRTESDAVTAEFFRPRHRVGNETSLLLSNCPDPCCRVALYCLY